MTYIKVKKLMEENPDISREEVMKKVKCGNLQAAAWMQRFKAEMEGKKRASASGRYATQAPKKASEIGVKREGPAPVKTEVTRRGRSKTSKAVEK